MKNYLSYITIFLVTLTLIPELKSDSFLHILDPSNQPRILTRELVDKETDEKPINCTRESCPEDFGICLKSNRCSCFKGYITLDNPKFGTTSCNYKQKSQLKAFLLEFLISFGAGHIYLENVDLGIIKMATIFIFVTLLCCSTRCLRMCHKTILEDCFPYFQTMFVCIFVAWQVYDTFMIGMRKYNDGNGVEMMAW